jgi:soluble lytic murein transglycosylase
MPKTAPEAAKLAGLPWDEARYKGDEKYNAALGAAYFKKQMQTFHGDLAQAYAAYNAGPGATQQAIAKANKEGGDWLALLPAETQHYVAKNLKAYAAGEGAHPRPTLQDVHAEALAQLGADASPTLRKSVLDESTRQYEEQAKAIKQRDEEATAEAMRQLLANGGKYAQLPINIQSAVPVQNVDNLMNFAAKLAKGDPVATDWSLYYQLKTDPALLKSVNLMTVRDKLDDPEFKQLTADQKGILSGDNTTQTRSASAILNGLMQQAGIDPTPKDGDKAGAVQVGRIWSAFDHQLADAERNAGRKLNGDEIKKLAGKLFTEVGVDGGFFRGDTTKPAILVDAQNDTVVVPEADRAQIIYALRTARPTIPVTEDDIFNIYMQRKGLF